jgi:Soluble lytic murein transglycosylase and related regulatory proteins (some contain LysM/invasin domains)
MQNISNKILPIFLSLVTVIFSPGLSADIYKYRDPSGRWVFTDTPRTTNFVKVQLKGWTNPARKYSTAILQERMKKYHSDVAAIAEDNGLPPELVHAVIAAESAYNPSAISPMGAVGLMQLMPATAERFGVKDSYSPTENIRGGCGYLRYLMGLFDGNLSLVLAAYNAGEGAVQKYGNAIPPYTETQNYVKKVKYFHRIFSQHTG